MYIYIYIHAYYSDLTYVRCHAIGLSVWVVYLSICLFLHLLQNSNASSACHIIKLCSHWT